MKRTGKHRSRTGQVFRVKPREGRARAATYALSLPAGAAAIWHLTQTSTLELSVAPMDEGVDLPGKKKEDEKEKKKKEEAKKIKDKEKKKERESPDFTIELVGDDRAAVTSPVSRFASIPPPFKEKFTKLAIWTTRVTTRIGKSFSKRSAHRSPRFSRPGTLKFSTSKLRIVRLKFDRTPMYKICISSIGFGKQ